MKQINPQTTIKLLDEIINQESKIVEVDGLRIKTRKNVFPPKSDVSRTSEKMHTLFGNVQGKTVLDVGTGTGVQAIHAAVGGASHVVAVDINLDAIICAKENVVLNHVEDIVDVRESDLFSAVKTDERFDIIIANLPITDYPVSGIVESALYDPDYELHKRFFEKAKEFLTPTGSIIMTHINFHGNEDFVEFEKMVYHYGYYIERYDETSAIGYLWRKYIIKYKHINEK